MSAPPELDALVRWAEVDVAALEHNTALIRGLVPPATALLAMVKSDGYGHGAVTAARAALAGGATWLGVYTPDEAFALRTAGIESRLLVVGWSPPRTLAELMARDVDITVVDAAGVEAVRAAAGSGAAPARIHIKIDSGLGRLGVRADAMQALIESLHGATAQVQVAGVFTHFADPERDHEYTREQHRRFLGAVEQLGPVAAGALLHTCGSAAILGFPEMHHDLVRLGIAMYGYAPVDLPTAAALRPAMTVVARVAQVKTVAGGETVGYGRTWRAAGARRIATVAIGYGQGVPRALSNRGTLVIGGQRCPIAGTVNMDQVTVDVSDLPGVVPGEPAMVFGVRDTVRQGADEVAALVGTIPHELLCGVSSQVPRVAVHTREPGG